jgi:hypothetical protein
MIAAKLSQTKRVGENQRLYKMTITTDSARLEAPFLGVVRDVTSRVGVTLLIFLKV